MTTTNFSLALPVEVVAGPQAVKALAIAINDRLVPLKPAPDRFRVAAGGRREQTFELSLGAGDNLIDLWATDQAGLQSLRRRIVVTRTSPAPQRALFLVTIGVSEYTNARYNLRYAAKDAQDIADFWGRHGRLASSVRPAIWTRRQEQYGFDDIRSLVLTNQLVTRQALAGVGQLIRQARIDDRVIITFSGHGLRDTNGNFYFATYDMDVAQPELCGFSDLDLQALLAQSGARENLLLLDTCNSGEAEPGLKETNLTSGPVLVTARAVGFRGVTVTLETRGADAVALEDVFRDLRAGAGGGVIAASGALDFALEDEHWKNGVFTYAWLNGLQSGKADLNNDTRVSFSELCEYVKTEVQRLTDGRQRPTIRRNPLAHNLTILEYSSTLIEPSQMDGP